MRRDLMRRGLVVCSLMFWLIAACDDRPHGNGVYDYARAKKEECLRSRDLMPPAGMTREKFCEAYGNVQALCKVKGKTGGACE